jgi:hypothetical protein
MNISRPLPVVLLLTTCLLSGSGCGGNDKIVAVTGKVTHEGKPVAGMIVSFVPQMQTESGTSTGETDENGEYSLTVFNTGQSGAVVGTHKVWVSLPHEPVEPVDKEDRMEKMRVEKKTKKRRSPATETLPPDTAQILKKYGRLDKTPLTVEVMGGPIDLKLD